MEDRRRRDVRATAVNTSTLQIKVTELTHYKCNASNRGHDSPDHRYRFRIRLNNSGSRYRVLKIKKSVAITKSDVAKSNATYRNIFELEHTLAERSRGGVERQIGDIRNLFAYSLCRGD